jgi:Ala-tRNA(Pro) deacylase
LSFGDPSLLQGALGVSPGSVTPFALLNDKDQRVTLVLDEDMMKSEKVNYHPLHNEASLVLAPQD